jgi:hypothetical protein
MINSRKGEGEALDPFFLAMAHQKLGHAFQARACFNRVIQWWDEQKDLPATHASELTSFRAEAEAVMAGSADDLPADVFTKTAIECQSRLSHDVTLRSTMKRG